MTVKFKIGEVYQIDYYDHFSWRREHTADLPADFILQDTGVCILLTPRMIYLTNETHSSDDRTSGGAILLSAIKKVKHFKAAR